MPLEGTKKVSTQDDKIFFNSKYEYNYASDRAANRLPALGFVCYPIEDSKCIDVLNHVPAVPISIQFSKTDTKEVLPMCR